MIGHRIPPLRLVTGHRSSRSMAATRKALRVALSANDERPRTHASGDDSHIAFARPHRTLTGDQYVLAVVTFASHIVVMAIDRLNGCLKRRHFARLPHRPHN